MSCRLFPVSTHARRAARIDAEGTTVPLYDQNRQHWDSAAITSGLDLVERALSRSQPGPIRSRRPSMPAIAKA